MDFGATCLTTVIVASGPSLTIDQCELAREARREGRCAIIAVNNSWQRASDADVLYAADGAWIKAYHADVRNGFDGECWTQDHAAAERYGWRWVKGDYGDGIGPIDGPIYFGGNSGFQAIQLARKFGARRILLIGFDMQIGPKGRMHWHGAHPGTLANGDPKGWVKHFNTMAPQLAAEGIEVTNCTITTALECFPRAPLQEALCATATA